MTEEQARQIFDLYKVKNHWIGAEAEFISFYFMRRANALCFEFKKKLNHLDEYVYSYIENLIEEAERLSKYHKKNMEEIEQKQDKEEKL